MTSHQMMSFLNAFSGYNRFLIHLEDQEKTYFIIEKGIYCNKVMPLGLKNAGVTYQRLVNKMFEKKIKKTMELYIDDMLVESLKAEDRIEYLR